MRTTAAIVREPGTPWERVAVGDRVVCSFIPACGTRRYRLDEINQGHRDLDDGKLIRGVVVHEARAVTR